MDHLIRRSLSMTSLRRLECNGRAAEVRWGNHYPAGPSLCSWRLYYGDTGLRVLTARARLVASRPTGRRRAREISSGIPVRS